MSTFHKILDKFLENSKKILRKFSKNFLKNSTLVQVYADNVILCGGAINTPQLLLLSGIGPKQHLDEFNIPIRHHLPGLNFLKNSKIWFLCESN